MPDIADIESKITANTKALVVINPNNPTGAVYSRDLLEELAAVARGTTWCCSPTRSTTGSSTRTRMHIPMALAPDVLPHLRWPVQVLPGRRLPFRLGRGHRAAAARALYIEGMTILANMRLCANVPSQ